MDTIGFHSAPWAYHTSIAFPIILPMGWKDSHPFFCAFTETIIEVSNHQLRTGMQSMSPHPLKAIADAPQQVTLFTAQPTKTTLGCTTPWHRNGTEPLACLDVYVDNIIGLAQTEWLQHVTHWLALHNIDLMFRANHTHEITRKQPISESTLLKGDAWWSTSKNLLGWDVDTTNSTIQLPAH